MTRPKTGYPQARSARLVVRELPDETLIYDLDRDNAHCLNSSAAAIWQLCNGKRSAAQIAKDLPEPLGPVDESVVWLALEQLGKDHLLEAHVTWPETIPRITRREAVRRIGLGAAIAIPLVSSIIAPTAAQAATCLTHCSPCSTGTQCCSGVCASNPPGCSGMRCV
jgi:hypothetical protein